MFYLALQLVQVVYVELLSVVDDYGIGIWDVQFGFNDIGINQYIIVFVDEVDQCFFQFFGVYLFVGVGDFYVWVYVVYYGGNVG